MDGICIGQEVLTANSNIPLNQASWCAFRQHEETSAGSHRKVTVPGKMSDELPPGTLNNIWKQAQLKENQ